MFAVAWGERAVELLQLGATRTGGTPERAGPLAVAGAEGAGDGNWRCWISGRLTNAEELRERFGMPPAAELPALLARAHAQLGLGACELLRGTFIVVALDRERETAMVIRDQLGGRPLVYARVSDGALLAEHERAIVDLLPSTPGPIVWRWRDGSSGAAFPQDAPCSRASGASRRRTGPCCPWARSRSSATGSPAMRASPAGRARRSPSIYAVRRSRRWSAPPRERAGPR